MLDPVSRANVKQYLNSVDLPKFAESQKRSLIANVTTLKGYGTSENRCQSRKEIFPDRDQR